MRRLGVLCTRATIIATIATISAGCMQPYERGQNALLDNDYNSAQQFARQGLDENKTHAESNLLMAQALSGEKRYSDALPYAVRAFKADHLQVQAGRTLGKIYWELGRAIDAVDVWKVARSIDPKSVRDDDYQRAIEAALALAASRRDAEATFSLRTDLKALDPNHPEASDALLHDASEYLAQALVEKGRLEDAITRYEELIAGQTDPQKKSTYRLELGTILLRLGRSDEATKSWQKSVDDTPAAKKDERLFEIARRAESVNEPQIASQFLKIALERMQKEDATFRRATLKLQIARLAMRAEDLPAAKSSIDSYLDDMRALNGTPLEGEVYRTAANVAFESEYPDLAIELLEEALTKAKPSWPVAQDLAERYARRGRSQDVERTLTQAIERSDNPTEAQAEAARWAVGRRNFELAKFYMERAVASSKNDKQTGPLYLELAKIYAELNDDTQLETALDAYILANPSNVDALLSAAELYQSKNISRSAEKALKAALKIDPQSSRVVDLLRETYTKSDRRNELRPLLDTWIRARGNEPLDILHAGESFVAIDDFENALYFFNRAAKAGQNNAYLLSADIYRSQQRTVEMKAALEEYLKKATDRRDALRQVLERYERISPEDTIRTLEELVALSPEDWPHYRALAEVYLEQNRQQETYALFEKYIDASADKSFALDNIARNFQTRDTTPWLLTFYKQRYAADPTQTQLLRLIGDAYLQQAYSNQLAGNSQSAPMLQAQNYYEQYLKNIKPTPENLRDFASDMRSNRLWSIAAIAYQTLLDKFPTSGATMLHYGETLLQLGNIEKAEELFATYFEMRGKNSADALTISRFLVEFKRYRTAETYLFVLFESKNPNDIQVAFSALAEIYRDTDRSREITPLINKFLEKSQNPNRARRLVLTLLENSGMWKESIEQLKRMRDLRDDSVDFALGVNSYRTGESEDAREYFERFAANSPEPGSAWLAIAQFYQQHAQTDDAITAYDQALSLNPRSSEILIQRGRFNIMTGNPDAGIADIKDATESLSDRDQKAVILAELVELLEEAGHNAQALQISRDAITQNPTERDVFLNQIAQHDLATNDPARINATIAFLRNESIDLDRLIHILSYYGHVEQAISLLQTEIEVGDQDVAANIILTHAFLFVNTGGTPRLLNAIRPLLTPPRIPDAELYASLGQTLIFYQELELGAQYIQAAVDMGATRYMPILAHAHLALGNQREAMTWFQKSLALNEASSTRMASTLEDALTTIAIRFELARDNAQFTDLLHVMFTQKEYAEGAASALVHEIIHQNNSPQPVFTMLRNSPWMPTQNDAPNATTALQVTRAVLQAVADQGFILEARTFLEELPEPIRQQKNLVELAQRLNLLSDSIPKPEQATASNIRATALDANTRARLLMIHGRYQDAEKAASAQLKSPDYLVARDTLDVQLSIARASAQDQLVDDIVKNFVANAEDKQAARNDAAEQLVRLGYDHAATELRAKNAYEIPIETNILTAIITAQNAGDTKALDQLAKSYWQVAETPINTTQEIARQLRGQIDIEHLEKLLKPAADILNTVPTAILSNIIREFTSGNVEKAREMLLETLESFNFEPRFTQAVLQELSKQGLVVEAARFLGPKLDDAALTRESQSLLGFANLKLKLPEDAQKHFDKYIKQSSDPAYSAAELATLLIHEQQYPLALHYADQAIALQAAISTTPLYSAQLSRDIALLATTVPGPTTPEIEQRLTKATASTFTYSQIARAALHAKNNDAALTAIQKIITAPAHDPYVNSPLQRVIDIFSTPQQALFGVNLLQQHYPRIANGAFNDANTNITSLASLYDNAGLYPHVEQLYNTAILAELARTPFSDALATYMNNLAYMYSTTNTNIDHGLDMARRAIAASSTRSPYLLDTLGWLQYRNGQFKESEAIIRRALRSSTAPPEQHSEYYHHLAELLELRGQRQQAIWLQILSDRTQ